MKLRWAGNREENRSLAFVKEKMDFGTVNAPLLIWWLRFKAVWVHTEYQSLGRKLKRIFLVRSFFNKAAILTLAWDLLCTAKHMFFLSRFPPRYIICKKKNLCTEKSLEFGRFRIYMTVLSLLNLILKYNTDCPIKAHTQTHNILSHSMLSKPFVMSWICAYRIAFSTKQVLISDYSLNFFQKEQAVSRCCQCHQGAMLPFSLLCVDSLHMRPFFFFFFVNVWKSLTLLRIPTLLKRKQANCFYSSGSLAG